VAMVCGPNESPAAVGCASGAVDGRGLGVSVGREIGHAGIR